LNREGAVYSGQNEILALYVVSIMAVVLGVTNDSLPGFIKGV
jgi:hypothetical protein